MQYRLNALYPVESEVLIIELIKHLLFIKGLIWNKSEFFQIFAQIACQQLTGFQ